ncbi:MAG: ATP-binding protein [Bacteroidales bacterium]|nr:ATP-binding protein [Bacteroidales bacterium]
MEQLVIGRKAEMEMLRRYIDSPKSEMVVVYGRRRVGKTFIVQNVCQGQYSFYMTGLYRRPKKQQLANFANALAVYSGQDLPIPTSWQEAFEQLRRYLSQITEGPKVIFLDELPWMETSKSDLVPALEAFWNGWGAAQGNLKLILCGSATSWIVKKIFKNKGGLFNRDTCRIFLQPFRLAETEQFCQSRNLGFSRTDVALCHMVLGGIPYYLDKLQPGMSMAQNIDNLLFRRGAMLENEFDFLYSSLFTNPDQYVNVVELLSHRKHGLTLTQIGTEMGKKLGGNLSEILHNLENCSIVTQISRITPKGREVCYQLCDFFTIFYLHYVKNNSTGDESFWQTRHASPEAYVWRGHAFELLCLTHIQQIREELGISGVPIQVSTLLTPEAQIDLIIERGNHEANLCEIKWAADEYEMKADYAEDIKKKEAAYRAVTRKRRSIINTLITTYGLKPGAHASVIQKVLTLDALFR